MGNLIETVKELFITFVCIAGITICVSLINSLLLSIVANIRQHLREQELATHELEIKKFILEETMKKCLEYDDTTKK